MYMKASPSGKVPLYDVTESLGTRIRRNWLLVIYVLYYRLIAHRYIAIKCYCEV